MKRSTRATARPAVLIACLLLLAVFGALLACTVVQSNPERIACFDDCLKKKNACVLEATTAEKIDQCDAGLKSCRVTCSKMPAYLPVK